MAYLTLLYMGFFVNGTACEGGGGQNCPRVFYLSWPLTMVPNPQFSILFVHGIFGFGDEKRFDLHNPKVMYRAPKIKFWPRIVNFAGFPQNTCL